MLGKKLISSLVLGSVLTAALVSPALAEGRHGHHRGHNDGAAVAVGILGALVVGSMIASASSAPVYSAPAPVYYLPQPQPYYQPQTYYPPAPAGYYETRPVQQVYSAPVYVEGGYRQYPY